MQIFHDATLKFSENQPQLAAVIPVMDGIDEDLTNAAVNRNYHPAVRAAARLAKATMNKYYSLTDAADAYRLSICECLLASQTVFAHSLLL